MLLVQPANNKKNPIAMFHDDFNALLLGRDDFSRLNSKPFSKKAVLYFAIQTPPKAREKSGYWMISVLNTQDYKILPHLPRETIKGR